MKKSKRALMFVFSIILVTVLSASLLISCKNLTEEEGFSAIQNALETSLSGTNKDIYYAKLTQVSYDDNGAKLTEILTVNVIADEEDYEIVKDENGEYANLRAEVTKSKAIGSREAEMVFSLKYGYISDGTKAVRRQVKDGDEQLITMNDGEFFESSEFNDFCLESLLWDTKNLTLSDINFDISQGTIKQKGKVTTVTFAVKQSYIDNYQMAFGKQTPFDADYVTVEISYGRIQSVMAYKREPGFENFPDAIAIDYETYKLEISYRGPKIDAYL